ncbi:MAG: chemotaxis protein CheB [Alteromonadaceae bacterium]|nr:MAG: chemotaxis protein CheB [Alteromonadaceae bacterium]
MLKLGLLAECSIQLQNLESIVACAGHDVAFSGVSSAEGLLPLPEADVWVVRIDAGDSPLLMDYLDGIDQPVMYDDPEAYSSLDIEERAKHFSKKIKAITQIRVESPYNLPRATTVWILAASAGGPEAVIEFIQLLPKDLHGVALLYAQHIDSYMTESLTKSLARNTGWKVFYSIQAHRVCEQCLYLLPPSCQVDFDDMGFLEPLNEPWEPPFKPSINQVIAKVARKYGKDCGVIIFSGMGDDGSQTCKLIANIGGQVWVQSPETCAIDSMPQNALDTNCVSFSGSPEALARHFVVFQGQNQNEAQTLAAAPKC